MRRLLVHVEGQTEETFVNEVLAPYLQASGFANVSARIVGNARQRERRGGIKGWNEVRSDIIRHMREDTQCYVTTLVDYYGLPRIGDNAWPGRAHAPNLPFPQRAPHVEKELEADVCRTMGDNFYPSRFIPFVMMHEFEALLFSDCGAFARSIGQPELTQSLQAIRNQFPTPEEINDLPGNAPSKRVETLIPTYQKPIFGALAALEIGLFSIRRECLHFNDWMSRLEAIAA